ncbi:lipid IV(A) 3-deoxy-D-manno-octulosonic acid transferase [Candidatus Providencia siddallii]|uniref:3-deoxy-D-manno-octulosonic acid transferase n=1 Tax=Candidatus Providencia siddallii TaxID=1715285 RepID=A0ABM9NNE1_9GAMM
MLMFLYQVISYIVQPFIFLKMMLRSFKFSEYRKRLDERYGFCYGKVVSKGILIHSVSIGETVAAVPLIRLLLRYYPFLPIIVSTITPAASNLVVSVFGKTIYHVYLPYDLFFSMRRFLRYLNPKLVIILETEIWPNMINQLYKMNIPVFIVNARLSDNSFIKYKKIYFFIKYILSNITKVFAQSLNDGERFIELGLNRVKLKIIENMKFDIYISNDLIVSSMLLKKRIGICRDIWIAGSTHKGEEKIILKTYKNLLKFFPKLLLIIVPRDFNRFNKIKKMIQKMGFNFILRSSNKLPTSNVQVLIGDLMNELVLLYGISDIVFIGGSLVKIGGHNPLEAAIYHLPIIIGPYIFNFKNICEKLIKANGLIVVTDVKSMTLAIFNLLVNKKLRLYYGNNAAKVLYENQGVSNILLKELKQYLI